MDVKERTVGDATIVDVTGDVEMRSSPALRKELLALTVTKKAHIVVNLEGVSYIDSSGIATLIECLQGVKRYDGAFRLYGVNPQIQNVFAMAKLDRIFAICESEKEALTK